MTVQINERTIEVPQSWNELPLKQQLTCYAILMTDTRNLLAPQELFPAKRILLVQTLLGVDSRFLKDWEQDCIEAEGEARGKDTFIFELGELLTVTNFLFEAVEKDSSKYQVKLGLTKCPFPELVRTKKNQKKKTLFAPLDALKNVTIYELGVSFTLFEKFLKTKDESVANQLLAVLYRPKKQATAHNKQSGYEGDIRQPYLKHESMVKKRVLHIAKLPQPVKQLLLFWFASCRQLIVNSFPKVFTAPEEGEKNGNDYGWGGVIMNLSDGLANVDNVSSQRYSNALAYISMLEDERQKAKRKRLNS